MVDLDPGALVVRPVSSAAASSVASKPLGMESCDNEADAWRDRVDQAALARFAANGFLVIENALSEVEVRTLQQTFDSQVSALPLSHTRSRGVSGPELFEKTASWDGLLNHRSVWPICRRIIGPRIR